MAAIALAGCVGETTAEKIQAQSWFFHHDATGVAFELPPSWHAIESGSALVFSGPPESANYHTTVTFQAAARETDTTLDETLILAHADLTLLPQFAWHLCEPTIVATRPALRYGLQVELHESLRLKHGVIFEASGTVVNLVYAATPEVFPKGIVAFEHILATVAVVDTTP